MTLEELENRLIDQETTTRIHAANSVMRFKQC